MNLSLEISPFLLFFYNIRIPFIYYSILTIMPLGIFLNIITIYIYIKGFSKTSIGFYYPIMLIIDCFALIDGIYYYYYNVILTIKPTDISIFWCKFFKYVRRIMLQFPIWIQVFITIDRCLGTKFPYLISYLKNKIICCKILFGLFVILNIFLSPSWFYIIKTKGNESKCTVEYHSISIYLHFEEVIIGLFLPFILMLFLNIFLVKSLILSKKPLYHRNSFRREKLFGMTIIALNLIFIIMNSPKAIFSLISKLNIYNEVVKDLNIDDGINDISTMFAFFYLSLEFFINLLFNRTFRKEFILIIKFFIMKFK